MKSYKFSAILFSFVVAFAFLLMSSISSVEADSFPDLIVDSIAFDPALRYPIITIKNQGTAAAKAGNGIAVAYVWFNAADSIVGQEGINLTGSLNLAPDQSLPVGLQAGVSGVSDDFLPVPNAVKVRVRVDKANDVAESNENNNTKEADLPEADADNLTYPIVELGNCQNREDCRNYCSQPANTQACVAFGKSAGLLSAEEAAEAEKVAPLMQSGQMPGGGKTREETEAYCDKKENRAECDKFFEQAGVKKGGGQEGENVPSIFQNESGGPGGCKTKAECDTYCDTHPGECDEQVRQAGGKARATDIKLPVYNFFTSY